MMQTLTDPTLIDRTALVDLIRRYGNETTDAVLDPACHYFSIPAIEGIVGYRLHGKYALVFGNPICAPENEKQLTLAFSDYCHQKGFVITYVMVSDSFAKWVSSHFPIVSIAFGKCLWINPQHNPMDNTGRHGSLIRRKVKHALKEGTEVSEYTSSDPELEAAMENVGVAWLKSREGPQVHISNIHLFEDRQGKRWFYASKEGKVVGVVQLNRLQQKNGWLLNHLMITPDCSHGTPEILVTSALQAVAEEGGEYVTFGACPASHLDSIAGLNPLSASIVRMGYQIARKIFHLDGFGEFWSKFQPDSKETYLLFEKGSISLKGIQSLLRALNIIR